MPGALISGLKKMYVKLDKMNEDLHSAIPLLKIAQRLLEEDHDSSWIDSFPTQGSGAADVTRFKAASDATLAFPGLVSYLQSA